MHFKRPVLFSTNVALVCDNYYTIVIYSGTPRIGAVGWKFDLFTLKWTPRIGAAFAYRGTLPEIFLLSDISCA